MPRCEVCFRHCELKEGQLGFCGARICAGGQVTASNYGRITALALDPIEKKPLRRFMPGSRILRSATAREETSAWRSPTTSRWSDMNMCGIPRN